MAQLVNGGDPVDEDFPTGPAIGQPVPDFELPDQHGNLVRFSAVQDGHKVLILFHRSASW